MTSRSEMKRFTVLMIAAYVIYILKYVALLNDIKQRTKEAMRCRKYSYVHRRPCRIHSTAFLLPSLKFSNTKMGNRKLYNTYEMILQDSKEFDKPSLLLIVLFLFILRKIYLAQNTLFTKDTIERKLLVDALDLEMKDCLLNKKSYWPKSYRKMFDFSHKIATSMFSQCFAYPVFNMSRLASYRPVLSVETTMSFMRLSEAGFRYSLPENAVVCDGCMKRNPLTLTDGTTPSNAIYHNPGCGYIIQDTSQYSSNAISAAGVSRVRSIESLSGVASTEECPTLGGINDDTTSDLTSNVNLADRTRNGESILLTVNSEDDSQSLPSAGVSTSAASPATTSIDNGISEKTNIRVSSVQRTRPIQNCIKSAVTVRVWEKRDSEDQSPNSSKDLQTRPYFEAIDVVIATHVPLTERQRARRLYSRRDSVEAEFENLARRNTPIGPVDYNTSTGRRMSFLLGPVHLRRWANDLANQGIFYTGRENIGRCCECNMSWSLDLSDDAIRTLENHPRSCQNLSHN